VDRMIPPNQIIPANVRISPRFQIQQPWLGVAEFWRLVTGLMKTHNTLFGAICVGTVLTTTLWPGTIGAQRVSGAGVVAVAPRLDDLGSDWTQREIVFAVDPLDQPPETVNEAAGRDQTNRRALLAQVKAGMESEGAAG
jgi:hypothetical protein